MINLPKNKFYYIYDISNCKGDISIVIAGTIKEAKKLYARTEGVNHWVNLRVKAVRGGDTFWYRCGKTHYHFKVLGTGFLYTPLVGQVDLGWGKFLEELILQERYFLVG